MPRLLVYRELERRDSRLCRRVIFLTGDTLSPQVAEPLARTGLPSVSEPVTPDEVQRVVQRGLRAPRG